MSDNVNNTNSLLCSVVIYSLVSYLCCLPGWLTGVVFAVLGSQLNMILPENYRNSLICLIPLAVASYWYPIIFLPVESFTIKLSFDLRLLLCYNLTK